MCILLCPRFLILVTYLHLPMVEIYHSTPIMSWHVLSGLKLVSFLLICITTELVSMWNLTRVEIQLCNMLSPEGPQDSLRSYNWGLVSVSCKALTYFGGLDILCNDLLKSVLVRLQFQVFIAVLVDNFLYPMSAFRSHFSQSINWSGIRYYLRDGKVSKVRNII